MMLMTIFQWLTPDSVHVTYKKLVISLNFTPPLLESFYLPLEGALCDIFTAIAPIAALFLPELYQPCACAHTGMTQFHCLNIPD